MKRKLLSILLTLCMVLTLLPTVALAEGETHSHCVCGATHSDVGDHTTENVITEWTAWPESGLPTEGNYYLTGNVTISSQWKIENGKNVVLCLNGHTLTADNATVSDTILIEGTLTITDCVGTGIITGNNTSSDGNHKAIVVSTVYSDCTLNLYGGKITGINAGSGNGGGVHNEGTFNMYGGEISGNTAPNGSGVDNYKNTTVTNYLGPANFNFYGGTIKDSIQNRANSMINANGGTVAGTVTNKGTLQTESGYTGTTFNGAVANEGTISGGSFNGAVANEGTISGGSFTGDVKNSGTISGGSFTGAVTNQANGEVEGGTFNGVTYNGEITADTSWYIGHENDSSFTISTAAQLLGLAQLVNGTTINGQTVNTNFAMQTITLTQDISLAIINDDWTPIGNGKRSGSTFSGTTYFNGTFDGGGHTISGLKINTNSNDAEDALGLFGVVTGTVKNLKLTGVNISTTNNKNTGAAVGLFAKAWGTVENITVSGTVKGADGVGGVVGRMTVSGTIKNCVNNATVNSGAKAGGIVGAAYYTGAPEPHTTAIKFTTIENCTNNGTVTSTGGYVGGIAGLSAAKVSGCENTGAVTGSGTSIGGIVGEQQSYGSVTGCTNSGAVKNTYNDKGTGGIVGWVRYNESADNYPVKAVVSVTNNINRGKVEGGSDAGGIVGMVYHAANVTGNENTATSLSSSDFVAGICNFQSLTENVADQPVQGNSAYSETIPWAMLNCSNNVSTTTLAQMNNGESACEDLYVYDNVKAANTGTIGNNSTEWVAKIGTAKYATLAAAVEAAESGSTIALLTDVTLAETLSVPDGKSVVLDLNDNTIAAADETVTIEGALAVCGSGKVAAALKDSVTAAQGYCLSAEADTNDLYDVAAHGVNCTSAVTTEPTYNREGVCTYYCTHCGKVARTSPISRLILYVPGNNTGSADDTDDSTDVQFSDVPTNAYYAAAVNWAVAQGITTGTTATTFGPDLNCTRAQIVTFLYRCAVAQGADVSVGADTNILSYTDALEVPEYAFEAFQWACGAGIIQGAGGKLMPGDTCTRAQIVTMLYRYAVATGADVSVGADTNILSYADALEIPEYAFEAFQWACGAGIIQGADGKLMPNGTCTRAQIVTMLYRANG